MNTMRAAGNGSNSWKRLARAGTFMFLVLGVSGVQTEATTITHTFSPGTPVNDFVFLSPPDGDTPGHFSTFRLGFDQVLTTFDITIEDFYGAGETLTIGSNTYDCVEMGQDTSLNPACVKFVVSGDPSLPVFGTDYAGGDGPGAINIGISYGLYGFPFDLDPVDLGQTDNFSTFMVFARLGPPKEYKLGHLPTGGTAFEDITTGEHCGHGNLNLCAETNDFNFTAAAVPEPATVSGVVWGLLGLTILSRRLRRRS